MYEPREAFEKKCLGCFKCSCSYDTHKKFEECYKEHLEEQNRLMLSDLIEVSKFPECFDPDCYEDYDSYESFAYMVKKIIIPTIEQVTQKKIEELKEYDDVCIDDLIGGNN